LQSLDTIDASSCILITPPRSPAFLLNTLLLRVTVVSRCLAKITERDEILSSKWQSERVSVAPLERDRRAECGRVFETKWEFYMLILVRLSFPYTTATRWLPTTIQPSNFRLNSLPDTNKAAYEVKLLNFT
jgi:hypothetical protein